MKNAPSVLIIAALLIGCGANKTYRITSEPPGAVVGAGKLTYGTTPFTTDLNTVLPNRGWDGKISASRQLNFQKDGYLPGTAVISEFGRSRDIHVDLQKATPDPPVREVVPRTRSTESRLRDAQNLLDQGLISREEYERKRQEILDGI